MQSGNISQSAILNLLSEGVHKGGFTLPHVIFELPMPEAYRSVLIGLFKIQHDFITQCRKYDGWFFAPADVVARSAKRSAVTVKRARRFLKAMGIIDYRLGSWQKKKATQYRILMDDFHLADLMMNGINQMAYKS